MKRLWFLLAMLPACATSGMSPAKSQKASDCAAMCERTQPPPPSGPMGKPAGGTPDTRSDCERRCGI